MAADLPIALKDWSITPGSNLPTGSTGINGNAFIEDPFIIAPGAGFGTVEINGVLFP